jgi:hypothetical protein
MPLHWWADDEPARVMPESSETRAREIAALLQQYQIRYDAPTLLALMRLTWKAAGELAYDSWRTSSIATRRSTATESMRRAPALHGGRSGPS